MKKIMLSITIGIVLLLVAAFVAYTYMGALASGWGPGTQAYSWNLAVGSYEELVADKGYIKHLEYVFQTRLEAMYKMEATVDFDSVTEEKLHITVTITNVQVPEDATEEYLDPEWHRKNVESRIDDTSFPKKDQSWSISPKQKECVLNIIREGVTFIKEEDVTVIEDFMQ